MVEHHLPDEVLLDYATGAADPGHALIAACHLTLCPHCRAVVADYEALGAAFTGLEAADTADGALQSDEELAARVLAALGPALDTNTPSSDSTSPMGESGGVFPWPLQRLIGRLDRLAWRRRLPGLRTFDIEVPGAATRIRMVEARAGMKVVGHGHRGLELDLVLAGGLHDKTRGGEFERGDIQASTAEVTHELEVLPGEPCVLLTINEGAFVPNGLVSRLVYGYLGWS